MAFFNGTRLALTPRLTIVEGLKLINKFTLAEDVKTIQITQDQYSNGFALKQIVLAAKLNVDTSNVTDTEIEFRVYTDNKNRCLAYRAVKKNDVIVAMVDAELIGGVTRGNLVLNAHATGATLKGATYLTGYPTIGDNVSTPIKDILIEVYKGGYITLGKGSTIELWGC